MCNIILWVYLQFIDFLVRRWAKVGATIVDKAESVSCWSWFNERNICGNRSYFDLFGFELSTRNPLDIRAGNGERITLFFAEEIFAFVIELVNNEGRLYIFCCPALYTYSYLYTYTRIYLYKYLHMYIYT